MRNNEQNVAILSGSFKRNFVFIYTPLLVYHYDMLNIPTIVIENISEANIVPL